MFSGKLNKARIETDTKQLYHVYCHLAYPSTFQAWLDAPAEAWHYYSARQMIEQGRVQEVIDTIENLFNGSYT